MCTQVTVHIMLFMQFMQRARPTAPCLRLRGVTGACRSELFMLFMLFMQQARSTLVPP